MKVEDTWFFVPAREDGSEAIPRKNLRKLGDRPLVRHVLDTLLEHVPPERVVVSTESNEVGSLCPDGIRIHDRSDALTKPDVTLDEVALDVAGWLLERGGKPHDHFLTLQPSSPFLRFESVRRCLDVLRSDEWSSVLTVVDDRKLRWTRNDNGVGVPLYDERVNRSSLPPNYAETGGVVGVSIEKLEEEETRFVTPVGLIEVNERQGLDIDTHADWAQAEFYLNRRCIVIRADAGETLGFGHVNRAVALAYELSSHDVRIVTRGESGDLGQEFLIDKPFPVHTVQSDEEFFEYLRDFQPDICILDVLDTEEQFVNAVREDTDFVVNFEDLGPGTRQADVVINDLYTDRYPETNHWYGVEHAILAPEFERVEPREQTPERVREVLVTFGGSDPSNLTELSLKALSRSTFEGDVTVVLGPGYSHGPPDLSEYDLTGAVKRSVDNMPELMKKAELALTSAGRTVTELMTVGVPTIVMCQNNREMRHTHASSPFGVMNLGMGRHVDVSTLTDHVNLVVEDPDWRSSMTARQQEAVSERSNRKIVQRILDKYEEVRKNGPT